MLFGAAYYPEHRDPSRWDYDLDLMAEAQLNAVRVGEFAWKRFEPEEGRYDFEWMDTFAEKAAARHIGLVMCPPMRTAPAWLVEKDPTILIEIGSGVRFEYGSRYTFCINHPLLRDKGLSLATAMAKLYGRSGNIIGWHLDNEYGDEPDCHCPLCRRAFQTWLQSRYKAIDALNRAWGTVFWGLEFNHFGQVPTPRATKAHHNPGHLQAWRQFRSDCTVGLVGEHANAVRSHVRDQFISTNNQALWNDRTDYYDMARHLDVCGTNYYPPYGEDCRRIAFGLATVRSYKQRPFHVFELRSGPHLFPGRDGNSPQPGEIERLTMHTIANGADGIFYFRWRACPFGPEQHHSSVTDHDGRPLRVYEECKSVGQKIKRLTPLLSGAEVRSEVAVLWDYPSRWMLASTHGPHTRRLYRTRCCLLYNAVRSLGINCDAVGRDNDFAAYKVLLIPLLPGIDDRLAEKFADYVRRGGVLVWHPMSGMKNMEAEVFPGRLHPRLSDLFGITLGEFATSGEEEVRTFNWQKKTYNGRLFFDLPTIEDAACLAVYTSSWFAGTPAVTARQVGRGSALYLAPFAGKPFYKDFLLTLCQEAGVKPILDAPIPEAIEISARRVPNGDELIFLLNSSAQEQEITLPEPMEDVWNTESVSSSVSLKPWGVRVLRRDADAAARAYGCPNTRTC